MYSDLVYDFGFAQFLDCLEIDDIDGLCADEALLCELYISYLECGQ